MQVENILQSKGRAVHTVAARATIGEAVELLNTRRIGAVVVVNDKGKVAGILSERDVVRHLGDRLGQPRCQTRQRCDDQGCRHHEPTQPPSPRSWSA